MPISLLIAAQAALVKADVTVARHYEGEGFVIEAAGVGRPKDGGLEMWNPDGKLDPQLQAAIDVHLKGTGRYPGASPANRKDRYIYTRIFYPMHAGAVYAQPDPVGDAQETNYRSIYCLHELVEVHYNPDTKVGPYTVALLGHSRVLGRTAFEPDSVLKSGSVQVHLVSIESVSSPKPKFKVGLRVEGWKFGDWVSLHFIDANGRPIKDSTRLYAQSTRPKESGLGTCVLDADPKAVRSVEVDVIPQIVVRFTDVPLDPK